MSNENKPIANSIKEQTYYKGKTAEVRKWAFASGELVYNLPWMLISSFLAFFMTDIALIPAQTVAILFLVCRIWDAVNDPMIGSMADRTKSKMGRYRPWMLGGAVCLMPIVVLLFYGAPVLECRSAHDIRLCALRFGSHCGDCVEYSFLGTQRSHFSVSE